MSHSVSGASSVSSQYQSQLAPSPPPAKQPPPPAQDSVQLSSAAKAASGGDADHDGDSS
jgi:hypothetical protein